MTTLTTSLPRIKRTLAMGLVAFALSSCDLLGPDESGPEGPGAFHASLVSPAGAEGSAVLELVGGFQLGTISPEGGQAFYEYQGTSVRLVIILDEPGPIRFQIRTEDVSVVPTASVIQVADAGNQLRASLEGYSLQLEQVPDPDNGWERE
jgi:hypothetical protein